MKKIIIGIVAFSAFAFACNQGNNKAGKDVEPYRQVGVDNVNGNIPDTTDAIDLSTKKVDSANDKSDTSLHQ